MLKRVGREVLSSLTYSAPLEDDFSANLMPNHISEVKLKRDCALLYVPISLSVLTWPSMLSLALALSTSSLKPISSMARRCPLSSLRPHSHQVGVENCHGAVFGPKCAGVTKVTGVPGCQF